MTTHATSQIPSGQIPSSWPELQDHLHNSADQIDQSRFIAEAYLQNVLQNQDLTPEARTSLEEALAALELQVQAITLLKD